MDAIKGSAIWNGDDNTLTINATSSDTFSNPALSAPSFGALSGGVLVVSNAIGPPANVLVTSAVGGGVNLPVQSPAPPSIRSR